MSVQSRGALITTSYPKASNDVRERERHFIFPQPGGSVVQVPLQASGFQVVDFEWRGGGRYLEIADLQIRSSRSFLWPSAFVSEVTPQQVTPSGVIRREPERREKSHRFEITPDDRGRFVVEVPPDLLPPGRTLDPRFLSRIASAVFLSALSFVIVKNVDRLKRQFGSRRGTYLCFAIVLALVLLRNSSISPPSIGTDELSYMQAAFGIAKEPLPEGYSRQFWELPNLLYTAFGRLAFALSPHGERALSLLQAGLYLLSSFLLWNLAKRFANRAWANAVVLLFGLYGFHNYTAYFMPEMLYGFLFLLLASAWSLDYPQSPRRCALLSGAIATSLYYVKPNGLSLIAATILCTGLAPWLIPDPNRKRSAESAKLLLCVATSSALSFALMSLVLSPFEQDSQSPLDLGAYQGYLRTLAGIEASFRTEALAYLELTATHLALVGPLALGGVYFGCRWLIAQPKTQPDIRPLALFAIIAFLAALSLTIHFTISIGDHENLFQGATVARIHGRYYSFTLPLFFVLLASGLARPPSPVSSRLQSCLGLLIPIVLASILIYSALPGSRLNWFDFPEILGVDTALGLGLACLALATQGAAIGMPGLRWPKAASAWSLAALMAVSAYLSYAQVIRWNSETRHHTRAGSQFAQVVPESERPYTVLITSNEPMTYYFNFGFRYSTLLPNSNSSRIPESTALPERTRWIVTYNPEGTVGPDSRNFSLESEYLSYRLYRVQ